MHESIESVLLNECILHAKTLCASALAVNRLMWHVEHCEVCVYGWNWKCAECVVETESVQSVCGWHWNVKVSELFAYLNKYPIQLMVASISRESQSQTVHIRTTWCESNTLQTCGCFLHPTHFMLSCPFPPKYKKVGLHDHAHHWMSRLWRPFFISACYTSHDMYILEINQVNCLYYTT